MDISKCQVEIRTGTASLGEYVRNPENAQLWNCIRNGDTSFLSGGEERNWWFDGDIQGDDPQIIALYASRRADGQSKL